jgi:Peptidase_C39 like family
VYRSTRRAPSRLQRFLVGVVGIALVGTSLTAIAVATDAFGAGGIWLRVVNRVERFMAGPVPHRPTVATVKVTEPPPETEPPTATPATPKPGESASPTPEPTPTPKPKPKPKPVDVDIVRAPNKVFAHEIRVDWCAPAGVQMVLATLGRVNTSDDTQREIAGRVHEWEAYSDSHNGEWGPGAMALALDAYGAPGYEVRAFETMTYALRDAAAAIKKTKSPAILLAWRGAHTWVMTGYRADSDPATFRNAKIDGAYILDPWYPDVSSIWGPSNPPGFFTTFGELQDNFLPWKRPEGHYPDRDGLFITVVPTKARPG